MIETITLILVPCIVVMIIICGLIEEHMERKRFNKGICPKCNAKLVCFDTDSQGGRGYICRKCNYTTWVNYTHIDKKKE